MTRWQQHAKRRSASLSGSLRIRERRRAESISAAVKDLVSKGGPGTVQHAEIARATGVPVGYLEWKYPSEAELLSEAARIRPVYSASATALGNSPIEASGATHFVRRWRASSDGEPGAAV